MSVQPFLFGEGWMEVKDGDPTVIDIFRRHYTYKPPKAGRRKQALAVGPGERVVLLLASAEALCAWRCEQHRIDGQEGVNCAIFRREGGAVASDLLRDAMDRAWERWPGERLFTFVDPLEVSITWRAGRPTWGHCFYQAGWRFAGLTKQRKHILDVRPEWLERRCAA